MKKFLMIVLALMMALTTIACGAKTDAPAAAPEVNVPVEDIANEIMQIPDMFPMLGFMGEDILTEMFGVDFSLLEEYSLNDPMMNVHAHIVYVAKVKDVANMEAVKASFQTRLEAMQGMFEMYLPDQYDIACNAKLETLEDGTILMVMSPDQDQIFDSIKAAVLG